MSDKTRAAIEKREARLAAAQNPPKPKKAEPKVEKPES